MGARRQGFALRFHAVAHALCVGRVAAVATLAAAQSAADKIVAHAARVT
jgi:hypothetical protein